MGLSNGEAYISEGMGTASPMDHEDDVQHLFSWLKTSELRYREFADAREISELEPRAMAESEPEVAGLTAGAVAAPHVAAATAERTVERASEIAVERPVEPPPQPLERTPATTEYRAPEHGLTEHGPIEQRLTDHGATAAGGAVAHPTPVTEPLPPISEPVAPSEPVGSAEPAGEIGVHTPSSASESPASESPASEPHASDDVSEPSEAAQPVRPQSVASRTLEAIFGRLGAGRDRLPDPRGRLRKLPGLGPRGRPR